MKEGDRMVSVTKDNAGEIFDELVKEKGLKKTFIAKKIGVSPQTLNTKIHHGGFDADLAFQVAKILDVNPAIFLAKTYTDRLKIKGK